MQPARPSPAESRTASSSRTRAATTGSSFAATCSSTAASSPGTKERSPSTPSSCDGCARSSRARSGSTSSSTSCRTSAAASTVLQDAWLDFKPSPKLRVRVGKFKSPVGLERLQSATAIDLRGARLPHRPRAQPRRRCPGPRRARGGRASPMPAALFDGAPDGGSVDADLNDGKDLAARVFLSPFKKGSSGLKRPGLRDRRHHGQAVGPPSRLPLGRTDQRHHDPHRGHRRRDAHPLLAAALLLLGAPRAARRVRCVRLEGQEADGTRVDLEAQGLAGHRHGGAHWRQGFLRRRPAQEALRSREGPVGRSRARGARPQARAEPRELDAGLIDPARSVREIYGVGGGAQLVRSHATSSRYADFEHVSFKGGAADGADREPENVVFIRTQVSF